MVLKSSNLDCSPGNTFHHSGPALLPNTDNVANLERPVCMQTGLSRLATLSVLGSSAGPEWWKVLPGEQSRLELFKTILCCSAMPARPRKPSRYVHATI